MLNLDFTLPKRKQPAPLVNIVPSPREVMEIPAELYQNLNHNSYLNSPKGGAAKNSNTFSNFNDFEETKATSR